MSTHQSSKTRLTRRSLDALPHQMLHEARNWSKADVYLLEWPQNSGQKVVVKDFQKRALWFRMAAGRYFLRREWNALRVLNNTPGVPRAIARPDGDSLVLEYVRGRPLSDMPDRGLDDATMQRIENLVEQLHARGVTHGDLHHENILLDETGNIALLDWATAHVFNKRNKAQSWMFEEWRALDLRSVAKIKLYHARHRVSERDYELLEGGSGAYRAVKVLRRTMDRLRGKTTTDRFERTMEKVRRRAAEAEAAAALENSETQK